ncbi:hypothetical protein F5Y14DRAFT_228565 [Nemania sp. NC0429]|nr:hypothetical protein F5Y14DRAFT_228565 [Nemania sp. NC0429]
MCGAWRMQLIVYVYSIVSAVETAHPCMPCLTPRLDFEYAFITDPDDSRGAQAAKKANVVERLSTLCVYAVQWSFLTIPSSNAWWQGYPQLYG